MSILRGPKRVRNKVFLLVLSLELFSLSLWGTLTYDGSKQELIKSINLRLEEAAFRTTTEIGNFLLPIKLQTKMITEGLALDFANEEAAELLLHHLIRSRPEMEEVSLLDSTGKEKIRISSMTSFGKEDLRDLANTDIIISALKNISTTSKIRFSQYLDPQLRHATPVVENGKIKSIVLAVVNLKWLWDVVQQQKIGNTGYVYVVNNDLQLIAHINQSLVLSQLNLARTKVPAGLFHAKSSSRFIVYNNFSGTEVAGIAHFDTTNKWWVVVEQPVKEGLEPLDRIINRFILVFMVAVLVTLVSVLIFSRIITRPLAQFEDGIARIGQGDRNVSIPVPKHTELAAIATNFNSMAENLDSQFTQLVKSEQRVRDSEENYRTLNSTLKQHIEEATKKLLDTNHVLEAALMRAEQANKAKSTFLANMSHELRTPLNAIIGYSELMFDGNADKQNSKDLEKIIQSGKHLLHIINDLLDLSKIEAGKMDVSIEQIDIAALMESSIDTVQPLIDANQNSIEIHTVDPVTLMQSDSTKLMQALVNLLSNAAKFTSSGKIIFSAKLIDDNNITFEVSDTGIGMSHQQIDSIFNVFAQADHSIQQRFGGSGLGLVISRHYCNLLGGDITVSSTVGVGSTFAITLPRILDISRNENNPAQNSPLDLPSQPNSLAS